MGLAVFMRARSKGACLSGLVPNEPEDILVEIGLQVLLADTVARAKQPSLGLG